MTAVLCLVILCLAYMLYRTHDQLKLLTSYQEAFNFIESSSAVCKHTNGEWEIRDGLSVFIGGHDLMNTIIHADAQWYPRSDGSRNPNYSWWTN